MRRRWWQRSESVSSQASSQTTASDVSYPGVKAPLTVICLSATLIASLGATTAGTIVAYPSPTITDLNSNTNPYHLNEAQETWIGCLAFLGSFVGTLFAGFLMDRIGRKLVIIMMAVPVVFGWEIIIASVDPTMMMIGRLITGFGRGILSSAVHVYIAEISPAFMRGSLLAIASLNNVLGNLYEYLLGSFIHWNWLAVSNMVIPCIMCILMCFVTESPRFLMMNGRREEAEETLEKLRGDFSWIPDEMKEIDENLQENARVFHLCREGSFFSPPLKKPLLIALGVFSVRALSGTNYVRTYALSIIREAGMTNFEANTQCVVLGLVGIGGVLVSCVVIDRIGRRGLLVMSCLAMTTCLVVIGTYFKMLSENSTYVRDNLYWMAAIGLVLNNFSYALAFDSIPWLIVSEYFPTRVRGKANSIVGCWESLISFLVTLILSAMDKSDQVDRYLGFYMCALMCLLGAILLYFIVPETKKETLENIQSKFNPPKDNLSVISHI